MSVLLSADYTLTRPRRQPGRSLSTICQLVGSVATIVLFGLSSEAFCDDFQAPSRPATGPLTVHPKNPRYFADASGKPVDLAGSHTWGNLVDYTYANGKSPPTHDCDLYLKFLKSHNHNCFRLWPWESSINLDAAATTTWYDPMPYERPGPGSAYDG